MDFWGDACTNVERGWLRIEGLRGKCEVINLSHRIYDKLRVDSPVDGFEED